MIGQYITQLDDLSETLGVPVIKGDTPIKERESLFAAFRTGEITCLVVSKVANFSIDLPEATIAIQVSGALVLGKKRRSGWAEFYDLRQMVAGLNSILSFQETR